jgi:hypothetical protein
MVRLMPTEWAIARRWSTAFVDPPRAMVRTWGERGHGG